MRRDCTTPIFSEPLNENNDKHVEKLQTICKLCSILPRVNLNVRVSAPQKKQTTLSHGAWDPPVIGFSAMTISEVNKQYMSKNCSVIIYLFVLVGGGVNFTNATILIRMHGEIKQASPLKQGMLALSSGITPIINLRYHHVFKTNSPPLWVH